MARRYKTSMNASCSVMCFPLGLLESDLVERLSHEILGLGLVPAPQPQHGVKEGVRVARRAQPCVVIATKAREFRPREANSSPQLTNTTTAAQGR